jgi:hypothetical protein
VTLRIYREGGSFRLIPEILARHLRVTGVVVFISGRVHQRSIAKEIIALALPEITAIHGETLSPNGCMCVVDPERYSLGDVIKQASDIDWEFEKNEERG